MSDFDLSVSITLKGWKKNGVALTGTEIGDITAYLRAQGMESQFAAELAGN